LFCITKVVGERLNSPVVIANAWHHQSDAYSSVLALLSIAWAMAGFKAANAATG
jgi:divalent metal cation (Fe/Co/Zn/Cd) transporter